jgi:hypothetical protein
MASPPYISNMMQKRPKSSMISATGQICKYIIMFGFAAEHYDVLADLADIGRKQQMI